MQINILTYYNAINVGAFLQAYCLRSFLSEIFTCDVYFVPQKEIKYFYKMYAPLLKSKNFKYIFNSIKRIRNSKIILGVLKRNILKFQVKIILIYLLLVVMSYGI